MSKLSPNQILILMVSASIFLLILGVLAGREVLLSLPSWMTYLGQDWVSFCSSLQAKLLGTTPTTWLALTITTAWIGLALEPFLRVIWLAKKIPSPTATLPTKLQKILNTLSLDNSTVALLPLHQPTAFCLGFLHPKIYLSLSLTEKLTPEELTAVVAHEVTHLKSNDQRRILIARLWQRLFFFLPALKLLTYQLELTQELRADAQAAQLTGQRPLLSALAKVEQLNTLPEVPSLGHLINQRVAKLLGYPAIAIKDHRRQQLAYLTTSLLISASLLFLTLWSPPRSTPPTSPSHPKNLCPKTAFNNCCGINA